MKHSILSKLLAVTLGLAVLAGQVACSNSQTINVVNTIAAQLPVYLTAASNIATVAGDPALAAVFQQVSSIAQTDYPIIQAAVKAYQTNQTSGNFNALVAAVNTAASQINAQVLQANKIADPKTEAVALASLSAFALVVNGMAIALAGVNKSSTPAATAALIGYDDVKGYLSQKDIEQTAAVYGVSADYVAGL